ncbi:MAG: hypothetical protein MRECE_22c028 [Mycoplasmataceae bacterium CE_OT135]|nr:MAG: hypothetical protein MRECE_22c028 [Mycoplasmataceae bacterium CE_OT135]
MKVKNKKIKSVSDIGFPKPKKVKCLFENCSNKVLVKFVIPKLDFSKKNDFYYLTEKEEYKGVYACDKCILNLYKNDKLRYLSLVENPKKRQLIRVYIHGGIFS